jgi:peptide/nickel transport system substrate-binding protein
MQNLVPPNVTFRLDPNGDPELNAAYADMTQQLDPNARQAAWARAQGIVLDKAYELPFGSLTKVQAVRADVQGFVPSRIPRMANVWFTH